jgi:hypothetical protein
MRAAISQRCVYSSVWRCPALLRPFARSEAVELQVHRMMQQLAMSPEKLAQAVSRIDSGVAVGAPGPAGDEPLFTVAEAQAAADAGGASGDGSLTAAAGETDDSPARVMASPVKTKLQEVFEQYSRPRRPATGVREGDSTTTAEEDTTEDEGSSKYSM